MYSPNIGITVTVFPDVMGMHSDLSILYHPEFQNTVIKNSYTKTIIISHLIKELNIIIDLSYSVYDTYTYI